MKTVKTLFDCFTNEPLLAVDYQGVLVGNNAVAQIFNIAMNQKIATENWRTITKQCERFGYWSGELNLIKTNSEKINISACGLLINYLGNEIYLFTLANNQEHVKAEKLLLQRLKIISDNSNTVTTLYSKNGAPEFISQQAQRIFGFTAEELMQQPPYQRILPEYQEAYKTFVSHAMAGKKNSEDFEFQYLRKDDTVIWVNMRINPVFDENNEVTFLQSACNEITKRKEFEQKLKESERNANAIINSSVSAILLLDKNYKIISANDRAKVLGTQLFTGPIKEGDDFYKATPKVYRETFKGYFEAALRGETGQNYRQIKFRNQRECWFHFKYTPIWDNDGKVNTVAWMATDVSDEKKSEEYTIKVLQQLSLANSAGEIGIWQYNFDNGILKFDDQCLNLFDKQIDVKMSLVKWAKLYSVNSRSKILAILGNKEINGKHNFEIELHLEKSIGNREFHRIKGRIEYKNGKAISAIGILQDVSKTKQAEKNLENSRNQLMQAQEIAKMGDFEYDIAKNTVSWSDNNYLLHGITNNKKPSLRNYISKIDQSERADFINALRQASHSNKSQELIIHFDNYVFNYTIKGIFYRNKLTKILGTVQDISDNVSLQEKLAQKDNEINESKKRMSEYSFMNSHKVRAPLSNILGLIQLLKLQYSEELFEMLEKSAEELDHVIHEVNSILAE